MWDGGIASDPTAATTYHTLNSQPMSRHNGSGQGKMLLGNNKAPPHLHKH